MIQDSVTPEDPEVIILHDDNEPGPIGIRDRDSDRVVSRRRPHTSMVTLTMKKLKTKTVRVTNQQVQKSCVPHAPKLDPPFRLTGGFKSHELETLPSNSIKIFPTRRCRVCVKKYGRRRESRYYCVQCGIPLCVVGCFKIYHTQTNYKNF